MSWLKRLLGQRKCAACAIAIGALETTRQELAATRAALATLTQERDAARVASAAAAARLQTLSRVELATGAAGCEAHGIVLAWKASHADLEEAQQHLAEMLQQNNLLRRQLQSVALQQMGTVDMLKVPLTDTTEPPKGGSN